MPYFLTVTKQYNNRAYFWRPVQKIGHHLYALFSSVQFYRLCRKWYIWTAGKRSLTFYLENRAPKICPICEPIISLDTSQVGIESLALYCFSPHFSHSTISQWRTPSITTKASRQTSSATLVILLTPWQERRVFKKNMMKWCLSLCIRTASLPLLP